MAVQPSVPQALTHNGSTTFCPAWSLQPAQEGRKKTKENLKDEVELKNKLRSNRRFENRVCPRHCLNLASVRVMVYLPEPSSRSWWRQIRLSGQRKAPALLGPAVRSSACWLRETTPCSACSHRLSLFELLVQVYLNCQAITCGRTYRLQYQTQRNIGTGGPPGTGKLQYCDLE
jgi:hypothetical protein